MILKTKFSFHPKLFILFFLTLTTIWSCKKDQKDDPAKTLNQIQISEAKSWLQNQKIGKRYTFDWSMAKTIVNEKRNAIALVLPDLGYEGKIITYNSILIYKNKGKITGNILYYMPESQAEPIDSLISIVDSDESKIKGNILVLNIDGKLLKQYKNLESPNSFKVKNHLQQSLSPNHKGNKISLTIDQLTNSDYYAAPGAPTTPTPEGCSDFFMVYSSNGQVTHIVFMGRRCGALSILEMEGDAPIVRITGSGVNDNNENGNWNYESSDPGINYEISTYEEGIDLAKKLECFKNVPDADATYSAKLCADLTVNDNPDALIDADGSGHAFITLTKTNGVTSVTESFGFYPKNGIKSGLGINGFATPVKSQINENELHEYNAYISMDNMSALDFNAMINSAKTLALSLLYDINDYNCTNYALQVFNNGADTNNQISIEDWVGKNTNTNYGKTPNALYKKIVKMKNSGNPNAHIITGKAPISTKCN